MKYKIANAKGKLDSNMNKAKERKDSRAEKHTCRSNELKSSEANVIQGLIVENHALVRVLDQLMHGKRRIVRLHDGIRHFGRRKYREGHHHPVRILLPDLGDQQCPHAGPSSPSQRMADLKTCSQENNSHVFTVGTDISSQTFGTVTKISLRGGGKQR